MRNDDQGIEFYSFPDAEIERLQHRIWILKYLRPNTIGAEIGVFRGHFSEKIVEYAKPKKLYLVDPWTLQGDRFSFSSPYTDDGRLPTAYAREEAKARMKRYSGTETIFSEMYSTDFFHDLSEELDFVYLDSSHRYKNTMEELLAADKVLSRNGVIIGDDWHPRPGHRHHGVFLAVNEFVKENEYEFVAAGQGSQYCIRRAQADNYKHL